MCKNFFSNFSQSVEEENTGLLLYRYHYNFVAFVWTEQLAGTKNIHHSHSFGGYSRGIRTSSDLVFATNSRGEYSFSSIPVLE
jgi:hypothetical protein